MIPENKPTAPRTEFGNYSPVAKQGGFARRLSPVKFSTFYAFNERLPFGIREEKRRL